jgi:hypothetical protein
VAIVQIFMVEVVMIPTLDFSVWSVKNTDLASGGAKELTLLGNEKQRSRVLGLQPLCSLTSPLVLEALLRRLITLEKCWIRCWIRSLSSGTGVVAWK